MIKSKWMNITHWKCLEAKYFIAKIRRKVKNEVAFKLNVLIINITYYNNYNNVTLGCLSIAHKVGTIITILYSFSKSKYSINRNLLFLNFKNKLIKSFYIL